MTSDEKAKIAEVLGMIASDAVTDASVLDTQPFTALGHNLGQLYAAVEALANVCAALLEALRVDNDPHGALEAAAYEDAMGSQ